ncbi:hypothetical protein FHX09_001662 [Rhizobium sp. BK538]|nr:hypothetical protein [Rhizobium sp. BK538]
MNDLERTAVPAGFPVYFRIAGLKDDAAAIRQMLAHGSKGGENGPLVEQYLKGMTGHDDQIEALFGSKILGVTLDPFDPVAMRLALGDIEHRCRGVGAGHVMTACCVGIADQPGAAAKIED